MTMLPFGDVAPIRRRALAYLIDAAIGFAICAVVPAVLVAVVAAVSGSLIPAVLVAGPLFGILSLAWFAVYTVMQSGRGSVGMRALGVRLADATDGAPIGFGRALLRNVIWGLAASIVVGYFSALFDGSGLFQGWHDKVGGAVVLDARTEGDRSFPQFLDTTQPPLVPSDVGRRSAFPAPPAPTAMPGFAASLGTPASSSPPPQTSMPGFAQPPADVPAPPAPPSTVPPAPDATPQPPADASQPDDAEFEEHTVLSPPINRDLPDDPLISFVPGVTQEQPRPSGEPVHVEPVHAEPAPVAPTSEPVQAHPFPMPPVPPLPGEPTTAPHEAAPAPSAQTAPQPAAGIVSDRADESDQADEGQDEDIESTRISVPGHRLVFTWDDGQRSTVSGRTVFGRNPEERDGATNVAVRDETRSLSKTHFEAGADARGGWVLDRQSTNGTVIVRDGLRIACPPGQRVPVRLGDALEIGDRIVTIGGYV